ncbi:hypothetical protein EX30DRAFT_374844 [Ascodesmis nigricans]|uniref:Uncharacterized protein n=1 Tax=Ascodesmis nigricans TaxID=341454 RepID=A0A4S2MR80_9PEZI|nr:hypothetical protein EX30DRAFT_374844 [Ascodesmis nigricans]
MAIERILNPELKGMEKDNGVEETVRVKVEPGVENGDDIEVLQHQPAKYPESKELATNGGKDPNPESSTITVDTSKHPSTPSKLPRPATTPRPKTAPSSSTTSPPHLHINSKIYIYLHAHTARNRLHITEPQHQLLRQLATRTVRALNITAKGKCPPEVWAQYENTVKTSPLLDAVRAQLEGELTWGNLEVREAWMWLLVRCLNSVQGSERVRRKEGEEGERERRRRRKKEYYPEFDEELLALLKPAALEKADRKEEMTDATPGKRKREDPSISPAWTPVNKSAPGSGFSKFKLETPVTASPQSAPAATTTSTTTPKPKKKSSSSSAIKRRRFTSPPSMNLKLHTMPSSTTTTSSSTSESEPNSSSRQRGVTTISAQEYKDIVKEQFERLRQEIPENLGEVHRVAVMKRFMEIAQALGRLVGREEGDEGEEVKVEEVLRLLVMMGRAAFVVEEEGEGEREKKKKEEKEEKEAKEAN